MSSSADAIPPGVVVWITGLSGAGKSVIAQRVFELVKPRNMNTVLLDGDHLRAMMGDDLQYSRDDRLVNAYRIARLCRLLSEQGIHVICSTMSLFRECHDWNRQNIRRYFEVYLRVPFDVLVQRDPKGLYARARRGEISGVVGVDLPFEEPLCSDLQIDNAEPRTEFGDIAETILRSAGLG